MTDIEQQARDALNAVATERGLIGGWDKHDRACHTSIEVMCREIEAHNATKAEFEAFKRDVSEAVKAAIDGCGHDGLRRLLSRSEEGANDMTYPTPNKPTLQEAAAVVLEECKRRRFLGGPRLSDLRKWSNPVPVDPLVEALKDCGINDIGTVTQSLREAIVKRGGKIIWDTDEPAPVDPLVEALVYACGRQGLGTTHTPGELAGYVREHLGDRLTIAAIRKEAEQEQDK